MARPTARVLQLLELLQASPRTRTVAELAEQLGVHERTVRRYLEHLVDLDVPVRTVRGRHGGVHLGAGTRMPPLMLTDAEALAVLLALQTAASAPGHVAAPAVLEAAASKVRRVLPAPVRARLQRAVGADAPGTGTPEADDASAGTGAGTGAAGATGTSPTTAGEASDVPRLPLAELLLVLERAVRERRPVVLDHTGARGHRRVRQVHPHGVVPRGDHWYLSAVDAASGEQRTFRLDRVTGARLDVGRFDPPDAGAEPAGPAELVQAALTDVPWRHEAVQRALPVGLATVRALPHAGAGAPADGDAGTTSDPDAEAGTRPWTEVTLRAQRLDWLPAAVLALPGAFTVLGPPALRDLVREQGRRLVAASAAGTADR